MRIQDPDSTPPRPEFPDNPTLPPLEADAAQLQASPAPVDKPRRAPNSRRRLREPSSNPFAPVRWSDLETTRLRELAAAGLRVGEIALRMGRSYGSITHRARKEGIVFPNFKRP